MGFLQLRQEGGNTLTNPLNYSVAALRAPTSAARTFVDYCRVICRQPVSSGKALNPLVIVVAVRHRWRAIGGMLYPLAIGAVPQCYHADFQDARVKIAFERRQQR